MQFPWLSHTIEERTEKYDLSSLGGIYHLCSASFISENSLDRALFFMQMLLLLALDL